MRIGTLKETYLTDAALFDSRTQKAWLAVLASALVLFPFFAGSYWLYLACLVAINVASASGLNILTGYTGLVSLGQAAFMGLGAYTVAVLQIRLGTPFLLNIVAGGFVAMLGGLVVGIPSLRVKGLYLAIVTIAASFIAHFLFANFHLTGGTGGLTVPPAQIFGVLLDTSFKLYWVIVPITALMLLGSPNLFRTRIGRAFIAFCDRDIWAEVLGIPLLRTLGEAGAAMLYIVALALAPSPDASLIPVYEEAGRMLEDAKCSSRDSIALLGRILEWRQFSGATDLEVPMVRGIQESESSAMTIAPRWRQQARQHPRRTRQTPAPRRCWP